MLHDSGALSEAFACSSTVNLVEIVTSALLVVWLIPSCRCSIFIISFAVRFSIFSLLDNYRPKQAKQTLEREITTSSMTETQANKSKQSTES